MQQVRETYETLGKKYLYYREVLRSEKYIQKLLKYIPKSATILDVGCGAGIPVDNLLVKAGHEVVGIDISPSMIEQARRNVPQADYVEQDLSTLKRGEYSVQAIVCLYTLFHVPRTTHLETLQKFASFLPKGGWLLISMGDREFEGEHEMYGVKSYSSQYGTQTNSQLVRNAGFEIELDEISNSGGENHQMVLARRK